MNDDDDPRADGPDAGDWEKELAETLHGPVLMVARRAYRQGLEEACAELGNHKPYDEVPGTDSPQVSCMCGARRYAAGSLDPDAPALLAFRLDRHNITHVDLTVFVGHTPRQRAFAGNLTLRAEEWNQLQAWVGESSWTAVVEPPNREER